jgi:hypothetical protein
MPCSGSAIDSGPSDGLSNQLVLRYRQTVHRESLLPLNLLRANRRALGYLLLFVITWGVTVQAAHSHGLVAPDRSGIAAVSDTGRSQSSDLGRSQHRDCSMCQFQQQLFHGTVQAPIFARIPHSEITFVSTHTVFYPSTSTTPQTGRAPPLA